jgi:hypothetical protein
MIRKKTRALAHPQSGDTNATDIVITMVNATTNRGRFDQKRMNLTGRGNAETLNSKL